MKLETTQSVKYAQMDMLIELRRICKKYGIGYFLVEGTLIGAIRHKGFIPWDDDIDVGMLREDYDRFIAVCREELDPAYALYDWYKDPASPIPFLKVKIEGTHYREILARDTKMNDGMYIDIFPFDNVPGSKFRRKIHGWKIYFTRKILLVRCGFAIDRGDRKRKLLYGMLGFLSKFRSVEKWKKYCDKLLTKYNGKETENVSNLCSAYAYERAMKPRTMVQELMEHEFEGELFSVPADYDGYLRSIYGDYMQLPPEDQRTGRHEIVNIDFGAYRVRFHGKQAE